MTRARPACWRRIGGAPPDWYPFVVYVHQNRDVLVLDIGVEWDSARMAIFQGNPDQGVIDSRGYLDVLGDVLY